MTLAFPGADGFGRNVTGARRTGSRDNPLSAEIILVTNTNDSGSGSLRSALAATGPKYIVPVVSGVIRGNSQLTYGNNCDNSTYLGQCAKLIFSRAQVRIEDVENAIIRGMIVQTGEALGPQNPSLDAFNATRNQDLILDHCWGMWSIDENMSIRNWKNSTMQWCVASEALHNSLHDSGAGHSMGGIIYGENVSYHHNLYIFNRSRNPQLAVEPIPETNFNGILDFRNNLIYGYDQPVTGTCSNTNLINNYFDPSFRGKGNFTQLTSNNFKFTHFTGAFQSGIKLHLSGNVHAGNKEITANNLLGFYTSYGGSTVLGNASDTLVDPHPVIDYFFDRDAYQSKALVERYAGYRLDLDYHEQRIFDSLRRKTIQLKGSDGIIDNEGQVGGYSLLRGKTYDYDVDGISIAWKEAVGLSVGVNVGNNYDLSPIYPNIEMFANSLVRGRWDI